MKIKLLLILLLYIFVDGNVFPQGMGISEVSITPNTSSILELRSTTKGLLVPRMTAVQIAAMNPLPAAAQGLLVFQTDGTQGYYYNTSITTIPTWVLIAAGGQPWTDLGAIVHNTTLTDQVSVGTSTPTAGVKFEVQSTGGIGIFGQESGGNVDNYGIYGFASGATNNNIGILAYGQGTSILDADTTYGILAIADVVASSNGIGAAGIISATNPDYAIGIQGYAEQKAASVSGNFYGGYFSPNALGTGATGFGIYADATGFATNWAGYFGPGNVYIENNLGIGAIAPAEKLDVQGRIFMLAGTAPAPTTDRLYNVSGNLFWNGNQLNPSGGTPWIRSAPSVFLSTGSDDVGIGTTAPQAKLHVADNVGNTMLLQVSSLTDNGEVSTLRTRGTIAAPTAVMASDYLGVFSFLGYNSASSIVTGASIQSMAAENFTGIANGANMIFATTPVGSTGNVPRMTILDNGNVGIGTTSPVSKMHVLGTAGNPSIPGAASTGVARMTSATGGALDIGQSVAVPQSLWMQAGSGGTALSLAIQPSGGAVGIGRSDPSMQMHMTGDLGLGITTYSPTPAQVITSGTGGFPSGVSVIEFIGGNSFTIAGLFTQSLPGTSAGKILILINTGTGNMTLADESASEPITINRLGNQGSGTVITTGAGSVILMYSPNATGSGGGSGRWVMLANKN